MTSLRGTGASRALVIGVASIIALAACGGAASPSPTAPPAGSPAASGSAPASLDPEARLAELKASLEGTSVIVGSSSFPNASITGAFKTLEYLEQEFGVTVDFRLLDSDPLVAAMISDQVQIGALSLAGMANANSAGADFVAIGGDDQKNTFVVAAKDPIESMEDLRGQPFAVTQNLNQITGQTARKCLETAGLDLEQDVQLLRLSNTGEATQAIRSGQVKGGISATFRLTGITLEDGDIYNILCRGWETNPQISTVWMVGRAWLEENEDLALALNIASLMSARWAKDNKDEWVALATEEVEGLTEEAASIDYDTLVTELDNWPVNGSLDRELCQQTLDTSLEFEAIDREYTVDELVTFDYQEEALAILGEA
jgi:ABC-type nitrate/sulfonate/bicarbonate transport system substrate-binding protein